MMNALAIDRRQPQTWTHTEQGLARFGACAPATAARDHHQSNPARLTSSQWRRNLGRGFGPARSLRLGWCASLNEIYALRRVDLSGADARAASINLQSTNQPAVQAFADLVPVVHSSASSVRSSNASTTSRKRFADEQNLIAAGVQSD